jgi:hypothetical protein
MTPRRYRCLSCGAVLPAWLPVAKRPDGALLLHHLAQQHPDQVGAYLDQIHTDADHDRVVVQAYTVVEEDEP